jgi:protein-S-isoprenylcysteine O-methyltransferase Ste14
MPPERIRTEKPMSRIITHYGLAIVIAAIILLMATGNFFTSSVGVIAVQVAALAAMIWARLAFPSKSFRFDTTPSAGTIIRVGPYRWIRHPMYGGAFIIVWASVLAHLSFLTLSLGAVVAAVVILRIAFEERTLRERYPDYAAYAAETKAVIPFVI